MDSHPRPASDSPPQPSVPPLPLTGERTSPGIPDENYWFQRHVATYRHVAARVSGTVVDAGCGEGYGLQILRNAGARGVIGVDRDEPTVQHARAAYASETIEVVEADLTELPLVMDTMDAVVMVQVIEHLSDVVTVLEEIVRITRSGGWVAISTPNRLTFSPGTTTPTNPFHVREFSARELHDVMEWAGIELTSIEGVHHGSELTERLAPHLQGRPVTALADATTWTDDLRRVVHGITPDDFVVTDHDIDASLDLLTWGRV